MYTYDNGQGQLVQGTRLFSLYKELYILIFGFVKYLQLLSLLVSAKVTNGPPGSESSSVDEHQVGEDQRMRSAVPRGEVLESLDTIVLENVPIITPNRDEVASDLTFTVSPNDNNLY